MTSTISYTSGLWIFVEFSRAVAPRFNEKGALYCEMGYNDTMTQTYCAFGKNFINLIKKY